jgi:hypothetical protein
VAQVSNYNVTVKLEPDPGMVLTSFEYLNMLFVIFQTFVKKEPHPSALNPSIIKSLFKYIHFLFTVQKTSSVFL